MPLFMFETTPQRRAWEALAVSHVYPMVCVSAR